jgi:hypothetical protein
MPVPLHSWFEHRQEQDDVGVKACIKLRWALKDLQLSLSSIVSSHWQKERNGMPALLEEFLTVVPSLRLLSGGRANEDEWEERIDVRKKGATPPSSSSFK